jgi:ABC-type glycerol-3-phosphate transport system substrate-binding protein
MARVWKKDRRRAGIALAALALLAGCSQPHRHNSAENEFTAWANDVERESANSQVNPDFEEPANVMARIVPANAQQGGGSGR